MKISTVIGALAAAAAISASVSAQIADPAKVKVNGIGLGSTYGQVVKALGKPVKDGESKNEECLGGREKEIEYAGLSIYLMDGDSKNRRTFEVKSIEVTSAKWPVSGVKVGDTATTVRAKFGRKYEVSVDKETGGTAWTYEIEGPDGPGSTTVNFKGGKVVSIRTSLIVC